MDDERDSRDIVPALFNAACPVQGVVTAGQPEEDQIDPLAQAGYRTILDLRAPEERRGYDEPEAVRRAGMEYVNLPVTGWTLSDATFDEFRSLLKDPERRPVVVHCTSANRVGAMLIPYLVLDEGKEPQEALQLAVEVGLRSQDLANVAFDYIQRAQSGRTERAER